MDKQTELFLNRAALKMAEGLSMEAAMRAVCADDVRIVSTFVNMNRTDRRRLASIIAERVFAS